MKAFVISLSNVQSSIASAKNVLEKLGEYGFDVDLFEGTYPEEGVELFNKEGRRIATKGIKTEKFLSNEYLLKHPKESLPSNVVSVTIRKDFILDPRFKNAKFPGVIGCFYSHYRLWQKCVELNEPIFIFEDDVIFERNFIPIDWDEILMVCLGKRAFEHEFYKPLLYSPEGEPAALDVPGSALPGAVGYAIKPTAAKKLVECYQKEMLPADTCLNMFVLKLQCHNYLMGRAAIKDDGKTSLTDPENRF